MRTLRLAAVLVLAALVAPAQAFAHSGLSSQKNLPLPEVVFAWAAAAVLVISFAALAVMWPKPKLEDRVPWRPLPLGIGRALGGRVVDIACGTIGVALLVITIVAGYVGDDIPTNNFAPTFVMITFWVGLVFGSILFGDIFRAFNPWRAIGRATGAVLGRRAPAPLPYPERFGRYPAAFVILFFTWIELVAHWETTPATLASAALGYTVVTLAAQSVWGTEEWSRRGEGFSVYFNFISRISVFETRDRVVGLRPPLGGVPKIDPVTGTVALVVVAIGTVTFDGLSQGSLWTQDIEPNVIDLFTSIGFGIVTAEKLAGTLGLVAAVALVGGFYSLGIEGAKTVGGGFTAKQLRRAFIHTLVPIAAVYVIAHYLTYFLYDGQNLRYLISDPFSQGWDLFGTASDGVDYSIISQETARWIWIGVIVLGHVAGLTLAHDRALKLYGQAKLAVRSQYWMLCVMVGFTSLALWLLFQANR
jgi:hypothetical protein